MVLDTAKRNALTDADFALPGRRYPIHDEAHARNALARIAQFGTEHEQAVVQMKVAKRYPGIDVESEHDKATAD